MTEVQTVILIGKNKITSTECTELESYLITHFRAVVIKTMFSDFLDLEVSK